MSVKGWAHPAAPPGVCPTPCPLFSLLCQYCVPSSLRPLWLKLAGVIQVDEQAEPQQHLWQLRDTAMGQRHEAESIVRIWAMLASRDSSNHSSITCFFHYVLATSVYLTVLSYCFQHCQNPLLERFVLNMLLLSAWVCWASSLSPAPV